MYHHKIINRFGVNGVIYDDAAIPRLKSEYMRLLTGAMRDSGYVVRLDIDPDFTIMYNGKGYDFDLSMYGVYVGKRRAQCVEYLDGTRPYMRVAKSPQLSPQQESKL